MTFKDLDELVQGGAHLDLPIRGKTYRIADVDAETGLWAQRLYDVSNAVHAGRQVDGADLDDLAEEQMFRRLLGDTLDELLADGVGWSAVKHVFMTVMAWIVVDEDTARQVWERGAPGEARGPAGNRRSRRASQAMERTTRQQGSMSGTKASRPGNRSGGGRSGSNGAS
jgi:uncharacterized membrane protein YgcG